MKLGQTIKKGLGDEEDLQSPGENSHHHPPDDHRQERAKLLVTPIYDEDAWSLAPAKPFFVCRRTCLPARSPTLGAEAGSASRTAGEDRRVLIPDEISSTTFSKNPPSFPSNRAGYNPLS